MKEMESWQFPPRYDAAYRPNPASRYWFPVRETFPRTDFKARRVIDDREVFRELNQKLRKS